jgi:hypothetical protein
MLMDIIKSANLERKPIDKPIWLQLRRQGPTTFFKNLFDLNKPVLECWNSEAGDRNPETKKDGIMDVASGSYGVQASSMKVSSPSDTVTPIAPF